MSAAITTISTPLTNPLERAAAFDPIVAAQPATQSVHTKLRLTRRGRAVFGTLATLLIVGSLAVVAMFSGAQAIATADAGDSDFWYVIAQPGDSLWQLASDLDSSADPRDLVAEIVRLNQLESSAVQAGQPIAVPLRYSDGTGVVSASELGL